jgi:ribose 5-phosphate isomerase B
MKVGIASDHAGYELKQYIIENLNEYNVSDFGTDSNQSVDYPDFAFNISKSISYKKNDFGIIICGSGVGVSITANKIKGVRAANVFNVEMARLARQHNDANVLTLGARFIDKDIALAMVREFLSTQFEGGRHEARVKKISSLTDC